MLKSDVVDKVSQRVYKKYPEFKGVKPKVKKRSQENNGGPHGYLLLYRTQASGPGGKSITRIVRAVTDKKGNVKKISTSK